MIPRKTMRNQTQGQFIVGPYRKVITETATFSRVRFHWNWHGDACELTDAAREALLREWLRLTIPELWCGGAPEGDPVVVSYLNDKLPTWWWRGEEGSTYFFKQEGQLICWPDTAHRFRQAIGDILNRPESWHS